MVEIEVQSKFVAELQELLMKYKVHMDIEFADRGDPNDHILFWAAPQYDEEGNLVAEHIDYRTKEMGW